MAVDYDPEDAVMCWPESDYNATLKSVEDKTSKIKADGTGGNPMEVWKFDVYRGDGKTQEITEYVVIPAATFKIKQLARALGKDDDFKAKKFHAVDYLGYSVTVELSIEQQPGYDDKNRIAKIKPKPFANADKPQASYPRNRETVATRAAPEQPFGTEQQFKEDDIPF